MSYFCCDERRRNAIREHSSLNGIDFLEVIDSPALPDSERQRNLAVFFIKDLAPDALGIENVRIDGGERIRNVRIVEVTVGGADSPPSPDSPRVLSVRVEDPGDFSPYTLRLVAGSGETAPPEDFDPVLSAVTFSFKVNCASEFDCRQTHVCPDEPKPAPEIDYLAKDYASFRQLLLDRLAVLTPGWRERNAADIGITLVELLAYTGDYLSYQQDAIATEAYLGTARRRISVRRHARLVDYQIGEGCNARAWLHIRVRDDVDAVQLPRRTTAAVTQVLTATPGLDPLIRPGSEQYEKALRAGPEIFELLHDATLRASHNELRFYTWGARECCLPKGAVRATLRGRYEHLRPGDVLIFEEVRGPATGQPSDADPVHRHAIVLKTVRLANDPLGGRFHEPPIDDAEPVTEIEWVDADALPFPLCVSSRSGATHYEDVSLAYGNVVLADHGRTIGGERLGAVPEPNPALVRVEPAAEGQCDRTTPPVTPARFRPYLSGAPVTFAAPFTFPSASAASAVRQAVQEALPAVFLEEEEDATQVWRPQRDLLNSSGEKKEFVVEVERDGVAWLRFGDERFGSRPAAGAVLLATYRTGNGSQGNVGAESLAHIVTDDPAIAGDLTNPLIISVRNPMPAAGGTEPETMEEVRQSAPSAFRRQERAVTAADYAERAQSCDASIQRSAATIRYTGSWRTVFVSVDRAGNAEVDSRLEEGVVRCLDRYRMAGQDVEVDGPRFVALDLELKVCIKPDYFRSDVRAALLERLSNRALPDGSKGVFHPDNFTFGQPVYLSRIYEAAQSVAGVSSVDITRFERQGVPSQEGIDLGRLDMERLEIARLDNDPNFPERGAFRLVLEGGR